MAPRELANRKKLGRKVGESKAADRRYQGQVEALREVPGEPFTLEHFKAWCQEFLVQSVDQWAGLPLLFEGWQDSFFGEALSRRDGQPLWRSVVLVVPRKNGKSTMLAAFALYSLLVGKGSPEILLAAASDRQAGRMFDTVVSFVRQNPELAAAVHLREYIGEISRIDSPGKILRMSSDPSTLHGYNPSLVICDELHAWSKPGHRKAWAALTTAGGARQLTQTVTITTPGTAEERADGILGQLVSRNEDEGVVEKTLGLTVSRNEQARTVVFNYSAPTRDPKDIAAMKLANPSSWITEEYLLRQASNPELSTAEVLQLHGGVWATGARAWLPDGAWDRCARPKRKVAKGTRIVAGFDGSYNNDSTALVGCTLDETPHVFVIGVWERPADAREWVVPREEVGAAVKRMFEDFDVAELACDPPGWHREVDEWAETYGAPPVVALPTNKRGMMAEMCSRLFTAVVNERATHDGNDRLAAHVANATVRETPDGAYITKEDRHSPRKIDLAVAAVLAFGRASVVAEESVYSSRGVLVF